jgi:hypothetical protein
MAEATAVPMLRLPWRSERVKRALQRIRAGGGNPALLSCPDR